MSGIDRPLLPPPAGFAETIGRLGGFARAERPASRPDEGALTIRLFQVLAELDSNEARFLHGSLPRADSTFGVGLAFFLAVASGGVRNWLGVRAARMIDALDDGLLIDELDQALKPRRRRTADGRTWWVSRLPVIIDQDLKRMICAVAVPRDPLGFRSFALQVRLPALGAVQMLAKGGDGNLEIVLNTAAALPREWSVELCAAAQHALSDLGLIGELTFAPLIGAWLDLDETLHADTVL
jgi:hypothetical protein